jgi:hypothetical protein
MACHVSKNVIVFFVDKDKTKFVTLFKFPCMYDAAAMVVT